MVITIFRSRLRPENATEYEAVAQRIDEIARGMPGFVSIKRYAAEDGERVSIIEFEDEETHRAWREHPEHRRAQQLGRDRFYSAFRVQVCVARADYSFPPRPGAA